MKRDLFWTFLDQVIRLGGNFLLILFLSRHLLTADFGLFSYGRTWIALLTPLALMGTEPLLMHLFVQHPSQTKSLLRLARRLRLLGALCGLTLAAYWSLTARDSTTQAVLWIVGLTPLFQALDVYDLFFRAQQRAYLAALCRLSVFFVFSLLRVALIVNGGTVFTLLWTLPLEYLFVAGFSLLLFKTGWRLADDNTTPPYRMAELARQAWPILSIGILALFCHYGDQLFIERLLGIEAIAIYSVAVQMTNLWTYIPVLAARSFMPRIAVRADDVVYESRSLKRLSRALVWIALIVIVVTECAADLLINKLFGPAFSAAIPVLRVYIISLLFIFLGVVMNQWAVSKNLQHLTLLSMFIGGLVNLVLNLLLIPPFGLIGSAWATVAGFAVATPLAPFLFKSLRPCARMICKSWLELY